MVDNYLNLPLGKDANFAGNVLLALNRITMDDELGGMCRELLRYATVCAVLVQN